MAYIKKLKDNELIGGTDNTDVYPVTSTEAVYNKENVSQEYINNHVDGSKIVDGTITTGKIADNAVTMGKLDNEVQTLIQQGADSSWTPKGDFNIETTYDANDVVFDPETNSSYLSLRADNMGHAVTDETWWMKVLDGSYVNRAIEEMEAAIAQAIEDAQEDISELISDSQATIDAAVSGANSAAQSANTAAANAEAKIDWVEEQVNSLTAYEVDNELDEESIIPVQNKVITQSIGKIEKGKVDNINVSLGSSINNYIGGNGLWKTGGTHYLIRVFEGDKLIISVRDDYTYYAWLNGTEISGTPSYSDGSTQAKVIHDGAILTVPANTEYLYFLRTIGSASHSPSTIIIKSFFNETKEKLEELDETINEIELINESCTKDYDLAFNDEYGYTIVKFIDGHIKTKNFDSRDISIDLALKFIKNKFYGKKCAIVGDSISTFSGWMPSGYAVYYPRGDVQSVNQTWWKITCDTLGMTPVNCAWSGSRVTGAPKGTTASAGCSDKRMEDVGRSGNPDIIIFFIGCNDWGNEVSIGTWNVNGAIVDDSEYTSSQTILDFRAAYALMLKKAQVSYPNAKIFCCTILDDIQRDSNVNYPSNNGNGVTTYTWNQSIKEIADALGVSVIDMHACGINYANLLDFVVDNGLHPNAAGHIKMANKVISEILSK